MNRIVWSFIRDRLRQTSTWAGIVSFVAGALGLGLKPEYHDAIVSVAVALAGLVCVVCDDSELSNHPVLPPKPEPDSRPVAKDRFGTGRNV